MLDCGEWFCGVIEWEKAEHLEKAMPKLVTFLDQWLDHLQEITPELGVTDPISGRAVVDLQQ